MKVLLVITILFTLNIQVKVVAQSWSPLNKQLDYCLGPCGVYTLFTTNGVLYVGGGFEQAGSTALNYIGVWDGSNWNNMGAGVTGFGGKEVKTILEFENQIHSGGDFNEMDYFTNTGKIAKYNGFNWFSVGGGGNKTQVILRPWKFIMESFRQFYRNGRRHL